MLKVSHRTEVAHIMHERIKVIGENSIEIFTTNLTQYNIILISDYSDNDNSRYTMSEPFGRILLGLLFLKYEEA